MKEGRKMNEMQVRGMLASALRAAQNGSDPFMALWAASFNLGVREFGEVGEIVECDPYRHEDTVGDLLRGHKCKIVACGWESVDGETLERALVEGV